MKAVSFNYKSCLLLTVCAFFLATTAQARKTRVSVTELARKSDCIIRGSVQALTQVKIGDRTTLPETLEIISIKVFKKIKESSATCTSVRDQIDVVVPAGPANGLRSEPCDLPEQGAVKDFYLDTQKYIVIPVSCYLWFQ